jgi:hypothetical protein
MELYVAGFVVVLAVGAVLYAANKQSIKRFSRDIEDTGDGSGGTVPAVVRITDKK